MKGKLRTRDLNTGKYYRYNWAKCEAFKNPPRLDRDIPKFLDEVEAFAGAIMTARGFEPVPQTIRPVQVADGDGFAPGELFAADWLLCRVRWARSAQRIALDDPTARQQDWLCTDIFAYQIACITSILESPLKFEALSKRQKENRRLANTSAPTHQRVVKLAESMLAAGYPERGLASKIEKRIGRSYSQIRRILRQHNL